MAMFAKIILAASIIGVFSMVSAAEAASDCQPFAKGNVITAERTAWGQDILIATKKHGKQIRLLDANTCELLQKKRVTKQRSTHRLEINNLWEQAGGEAGSPEIVFTERISATQLSLRIYTITTGFELEKLTNKTLTVTEGKANLSVDDLSLNVNDTPWQLIRWSGNITLKKTNNSLTFLAIGDQGEVGEGKTAVAAAMNGVAQTTGTLKFVTTVGDNFYPGDTIESTDDEDWEENFFTPYDLTYLDVPFHIALGNHDYDDNDLESILAYEDTTGKWNLPDNYYTVTYPESAAEPLLQLIVLDTEMIDDQDEEYEEQLTWLDDTLTASTARWVVVSGHHPAYSYGQHGDNASIVTNVLPLLKEHEVDVYLTGHDHDKQVIDHPDDDILHVISGAASRLRDTEQGANSLFAESSLGFAAFQIVKDTLSLTFYDTDQTVEYTKTLTK